MSTGGLLERREVRIPSERASLAGDLTVPGEPRSFVVFAHRSGGSRRSPRDRRVAEVLQEAGLATLLLDLLTTEEETADLERGHLRFDVAFLGRRLLDAANFLAGSYGSGRPFRVGLFGSSAGAAVALAAAAERPDRVGAVVCRGGRLELAGPHLSRVQAPTLLLVGSLDEPVLSINRAALLELGSKRRELVTVPGANHLFEEPGSLDEVTTRSAAWFSRHLRAVRGFPTR